MFDPDSDIAERLGNWRIVLLIPLIVLCFP